MKKAVEKAKEVAESEVAQLRVQIEGLRATATKRDKGWAAKKKNIAIVLAASNKRAQDTLAEEFPEVAANFNIKDKGMEAALNALRPVKSGISGAGSSGASVTRRKP